MGIRKHIRNFFGFTRAQTNGMIVLLIVVTGLLFSRPVYWWWTSNQPHDFSYNEAQLDSLLTVWSSDTLPHANDLSEHPSILFPFDPNTATAEELAALGFTSNLANRVVAYRSKGGVFRKPDDLKKIYGMDSLFFSTIRPYVEIVSFRQPTKASERKVDMVPASRQNSPIKFDINRADTALLKSIYGIGSRLSMRIVTYRESLGGFISLHQLNEIYGLDSVVIEQLTKGVFIQDDFTPQKLNINTASESELAGHPYISKRMALAVVTYRFQHGPYRSIEDLRKIIQVDDSLLNKIKPYLTVE